MSEDEPYSRIVSLALGVSVEVYRGQLRGEYTISSMTDEIERQAADVVFPIDTWSRAFIMDFLLNPAVLLRGGGIPPQIFKGFDHDLSVMAINRYCAEEFKRYDAAINKLMEYGK